MCIRDRRETFGLLKTSGSFFSKCNIVVMQCDDAVRDITFLKDTETLERYAAALTLNGGGGTDFRPAFARSDERHKEGRLRDLQGVLYFTDGKGTFPARPPAYQTAFLFLEDGSLSLIHIFLGPIPGTRSSCALVAVFTSTGKNSGWRRAQLHLGSR